MEIGAFAFAAWEAGVSAWSTHAKRCEATQGEAEEPIFAEMLQATSKPESKASPNWKQKLSIRRAPPGRAGRSALRCPPP